MGRSPDDARALGELVAKGVTSAVLFSTDDVDKTFEHTRASGAEVLQEPIEQPYGCGTARSATRPATTSGSPSRWADPSRHGGGGLACEHATARVPDPVPVPRLCPGGERHLPGPLPLVLHGVFGS